MLFQTQIFLLAWIVALTLSIEKMFRNNFYAIAGVVAGINLMQVALWVALRLRVTRNNNCMTAGNTGKGTKN
jgi:hypothetical protein